MSGLLRNHRMSFVLLFVGLFVLGCGALLPHVVYAQSFGDGEIELPIVLEDWSGVSFAYPLEQEFLDVVSAKQTTASQITLTGAGAITGVVTAEDTGVPLSGVSVGLSPFESWDTTFHYTDENGYFSFSNLVAGNYKLRFVEWDQYAFEFYDNKLRSQDADPIAVTSGVTVGLTIQLARGGAVTGTITAADTGLPLSQISAYAAYEGGHSYWVSSNIEGQYSIGGLAAGWYLICFHDYAGNYASECYDNKPGRYVGDPVTITPGENPPINVVLSPSAFIAGMVTSSGSGEPLNNVRVDVYRSDSQSSLGSATTDSAGTYRIGGLATGDYKVRFRDNTGNHLSEYYDGKADFYLADVISLTGGVTTTVNTQLTLGGRVSGRVIDGETGAGIASVQIVVERVGYDFSVSTRTDANGYYTTTAAPSGIYRVRFAPPAPYFAEYYDNFSPSTDFTAVIIDAPATTHNVNATLKQGFVISGRVMAAGQPVAGVHVRPYVSSNSYYASNLSKSTAADGTYTIGPLTGEEYYIQFVPPATTPYAPQWYTSAVTYASATPVVMPYPTSINVTLTAGSRITGVVTSLDAGQALPQVYVSVYEPGSNAELVNTSTDVNGHYVTPALAPGVYQLRFSPPWGSPYAPLWYPNAPEQRSAAIVTLAEGVNLTGVNVQLPQRTEETAAGAITGKVTGADTGQLVGLTACLYDDDPEQMLCGGWAKRGEFTISGWEAGQYHLYFHAPAPYASVFYKDAYIPEEATPITITANMTTTDVNQVLQIGGNITGAVTANGVGVPGTKVEISLVDDEAQSNAVLGGPGSWSGFKTRTTYVGANGLYQMPGLPGGRYRISFLPPAPYISQSYTRQANVAPSITGTPVTIELGQVKSNIDMTLTEGGVLTGTVTAVDTVQGLAEAQVTVYNLAEEVVASATTNMEGHYTTSGLAIGEYKVYFSSNVGYLAEWNDDAASFSTATAITVSGVGTVMLNATLDKGGTFSGYVYDQETVLPIPYAQVKFYDAATAKLLGITYANAWGYYRAAALAAGEYKVLFSYSGYIPCWYGNATTFDSAATVTVNLAQDTPAIHGYLTTGGSQVAPEITKAVSPEGRVQYGDELTYTVVISGVPGAEVSVYDPLTNTTFIRFIERPAGIEYANHAITGTTTIAPTNQITVSFVARVGVPGTVGVYVDVRNAACVYPTGQTISMCEWSNTVTNQAYRPYTIFLPLVIRNQ